MAQCIARAGQQRLAVVSKSLGGLAAIQVVARLQALGTSLDTPVVLAVKHRQVRLLRDPFQYLLCLLAETG